MPSCSILRLHRIQPALPGCRCACAWAFQEALTCAQGHQSMLFALQPQQSQAAWRFIQHQPNVKVVTGSCQLSCCAGRS